MDKQILELRQQIDELDEEIINLLKKRMGISKEVGKLRKSWILRSKIKPAKTKLLIALFNRQVEIYLKSS